MKLRSILLLCMLSLKVFPQKLRTDNMSINYLCYPAYVLPKELNTIEISIVNNTGNAYYQQQDMDWLKKTFYFDSTLKVVPANGQLKLTFTINPDKVVSCSAPNMYCYSMENAYVVTHRGAVITDGTCTNPNGMPYYTVSNTPTLDVNTYKVNVREQLVQLNKKIRSNFDYIMTPQNISFSRIKGDGFEKFDSLNNRMEDYFKAKKIRPPYASIEELLNKSFDYYNVLAGKKVEDADKQKNILFAIYSNEVILYSLLERFADAERSISKLEGLGMKENRTEYYKRFYNERKNNVETYHKNSALLNKNDLSYLFKDGKVPPPEEKKAVVANTVTAPKVKQKNNFNYAMTGNYFVSIPPNRTDEEVIADLKENFILNSEMKRQSIENLLIQRRYMLGLFLIDSGFAHGSELSYMFRTPFSDGPKNNMPIYAKQYSNKERLDFVKEYIKRGYKADQSAVILLDEEGASAKELQDFLIEQLDADAKNSIYNHYIYKAMEANNTEMFKSYIDKGVKLDPQYVNIAGSTNIDIMKMYQAQGIDLNANNPYGQTALRLGIESGKPENIKYLLEQGCDPCRKDNSGKNALDIAKKVDSFKSPEIKNEIIQLLKEKTANCK